MADSIQITPQVLVDTADKVRSINANLTNKLAEVTGALNGLQSTWQSDASKEVYDSIQKKQTRFEELHAVVESYAKFLVNTAQTYETTETSITNNTSSFK